MGIGRDINRFFGGVGSGIRKVGKQIGSGLKTAANFVAEKALPVIEKVASGVATGLKYATPLIGAIAPEFLPIAMGASALANTIGSAAGAGRKAIGLGKSIASAVPMVVGGIKSGNASKIISGIEKGVDIASSMPRISVPSIPPAIAAMRRIPL